MKTIPTKTIIRRFLPASFASGTTNQITTGGARLLFVVNSLDTTNRW
jgi:hypothetical protein